MACSNNANTTTTNNEAYVSLQTHIFTFVLIQQPRYPRKALQFFAYIPGVFWTIQQSTGTFKD